MVLYKPRRFISPLRCRPRSCRLFSVPAPQFRRRMPSSETPPQCSAIAVPFVNPKDEFPSPSRKPSKQPATVRPCPHRAESGRTSTIRESGRSRSPRTAPPLCRAGESHDCFLGVDRGDVDRPAAPPSPAPAADALKTEVHALVRKLDSPSLPVRTAAEEETPRPWAAGLGPVAGAQRGHVRRGEGAVGPHPAAICSRGRRKRPPRPRRSRSTSPAMRLSKILAEMQKQSGNPIIDARRQLGQPADDPELKVDFDKTPFWRALDEVLDQAGLEGLCLRPAARHQRGRPRRAGSRPAAAAPATAARSASSRSASLPAATFASRRAGP